jgi:hypothetical protein
MRAIGLRAAPKTVWYSVVEEPTENEGAIGLLVCQAIPVPDALREPERLRFVRQTIADTIAEYQAARAGIRLAEPIAQRIPIARLHLEGVLQELLASSPVEAYFYGAIAQIARLLAVDERKLVKQYINGLEFRGISGWDAMKQEARESVLVAIASLALEIG